LDARHAAVSALARIYSRRWPLTPQSSDPDTFSHLSEKIDFLNLLDSHPYPLLQNTLIERILDFPSLAALFHPLTQDDRVKHGKLLYRLLMHPRLKESLRQMIRAKNLTKQVGDYLDAFATSLEKTQPAMASACHALGAYLGNPASLWHIALKFHAEGEMQDLSKAVDYYTESYPLWKTAKDCEDVILKLKEIATQNKDEAAARAATTTLVTVLRKRCSTPSEGCALPLFDKISLLQALKLNMPFETSTEEKTISSEQEQFLKDIRASWKAIFTSSLCPSRKGELLYSLFTGVFTLEELSSQIQDENLKETLLTYLLAFAKHTSKLHAIKVYEITAQLGHPYSTWVLGGYYQTDATPRNLSKAVCWYEKCYPLYSTKNDHDDVLRELKKIAGQTVDQRASRAALAVLNRIYSARWQLPLAPEVTAPTVLAEKIDFLNLLLLHRDEVTEEKERDEQRDCLTQEIIGSWREVLAPQSSLTEAKQGELLHALLAQPLLSDTLYLALSEQQLEAKAAHCLQQFASTLESGTQQVFEAYQIGAKLGNSDCMLNLALIYINHTPPLLTEAIHWFEKCYALLDKESQRKEFFKRLLHAVLYSTHAAVRPALGSLFENIFAAEDKRSTPSQPEPFSVFSARVDYLYSFISAAPEENQPQLEALTSEKLLASWEGQISHSTQTSEEKGALLHRLLSHPLLKEKMHSQIRERKLEKEMSMHLNSYGALLSNGSWYITPDMLAVYKQGAAFGNPRSMNALALLFLDDEHINYSEAIAWLGKSYFFWETHSQREPVLGTLVKLAYDAPLRDKKKAKDVLDKIYFHNYSLIKTWRKSIALLPSLSRNEFNNLRKITLDDGREKWVPSDIASQWQRLTHLEYMKTAADSGYLFAFAHTIDEYSRELTDLQKELQGKTCTNSTVQAYYTLFQSGCLDTLAQEATSMQLRYLSTSEAWQDQADGIVRILEKSAKKDRDSREEKELSTAMAHWVEQFGTPAIFLKINAGSQQRLLHFILEQVTRGLPLAQELEKQLLLAWEGGRNASSRTALIQYYQEKQAFLEPSSEARSNVEQILACLRLEAYNASWRGQMAQVRNNLYQFFTPTPQRRKDVDQGAPPTLRAA